MKSTTGKIIRFTLQRTPTWAWAGSILEPYFIFPIRFQDPIGWSFTKEDFLSIMGVPEDILGAQRPCSIWVPR